MHPDIEFEGNAYSNSKKEKNLDKLNLESLIEPWGIPIKNTLNLREHSCVRYEEVSASIIQEASAKVQDKLVVNDVVIDDQASKSWFKKLGVDESLQEKVIQESKIIDKEVKGISQNLHCISSLIVFYRGSKIRKKGRERKDQDHRRRKSSDCKRKRSYSRGQPN